MQRILESAARGGDDWVYRALWGAFERNGRAGSATQWRRAPATDLRVWAGMLRHHLLVRCALRGARVERVSDAHVRGCRLLQAGSLGREDSLLWLGDVLRAQRHAVISASTAREFARAAYWTAAARFGSPHALHALAMMAVADGGGDGDELLDAAWNASTGAAFGYAEGLSWGGLAPQHAGMSGNSALMRGGGGGAGSDADDAAWIPVWLSRVVALVSRSWLRWLAAIGNLD